MEVNQFDRLSSEAKEWTQIRNKILIFGITTEKNIHLGRESEQSKKVRRKS